MDRHVRVQQMLFLTAFLITQVTALSCYSCGTVENDACGDPFGSSNAVPKECASITHMFKKPINESKNSPKFESLCVKYIAIVESERTTFRGCSYLEDLTCDEIQSAVEADGGKLEHCSTCSENLCNQAASFNQVTFVTISAISLLMLWLRSSLIVC